MVDSRYEDGGLWIVGGNVIHDGEVTHFGGKSRVGQPFTGDDLPMRDIHGIQVTVEAEKGTRREANPNWNLLPAHYGYINATGSHEGPMEQMDCFIGDDPESQAVWLVEQVKASGEFDEFKVMLCFPDKEAAIDAYQTTYEGSPYHMGNVRRMSVAGFRKFVSEWAS